MKQKHDKVYKRSEGTDQIHRDIVGMFTRYGRINPDYYRFKGKRLDNEKKTRQNTSAK